MGAYVKFKLGITHFTHNYMETSHVTSKIKLFTLQLGAGLNPRPTDNISALSHLSYPRMVICYVQLLFEHLSVCLTSLLFPWADAIPASIPISFSRLDATEVSTYY